MLSAERYNMLKKVEKKKEDGEKVSHKIFLDEELVISSTQEDIINDSVGSKGQTEEVTLVDTDVEIIEMDLKVDDSQDNKVDCEHYKSLKSYIVSKLVNYVCNVLLKNT